jgi:nucleotide-binding universal stress UspA family protein
VSQNTIRVVGLNEFRKGLRTLDRTLPKGVRVALNDAANILVDAARPKVPHRSGRAASSMRAQSTQTQARVAVGGPKAPYYPWLDFGGKTGRKKSVVRPFYKEGRYIFPTLVEKREAIQDAMLTALAALASEAGVEVD